MEQLKLDILDVAQGIICHQVNCRGVMGRGLALSIKNKWPVVFNEYRKFCLHTTDKLGLIQLVPVTNFITVCNVFGQYDYQGYGCHTSYTAVRQALTALEAARDNKQVYIPYNMGCGLGGGDWKTYNEIIQQTIPTAIIVRLI